MKYKIEENEISKKISLTNSINPEKIIHMVEGEVEDVLKNYFILKDTLKMRYVINDSKASFSINFDVEDVKDIYFIS